MATKGKISIGESVKSLLTHIKIYTEYYFAIVSALGIIWGVFTFYHKWKDGNDQLKKDVQVIIVTQKQQTKTDSLLLFNQNAMIMQLEENTKVTNSLQSSYVRYISNDKALTKSDFVKYMEGLSFDVKKNLLMLNGSTVPERQSIVSTK